MDRLRRPCDPFGRQSGLKKLFEVQMSTKNWTAASKISKAQTVKRGSSKYKRTARMALRTLEHNHCTRERCKSAPQAINLNSTTTKLQISKSESGSVFDFVYICDCLPLLWFQTASGLFEKFAVHQNPIYRNIYGSIWAVFSTDFLSKKLLVQ